MLSVIQPIDPLKLHAAWQFILHGLNDIRRKAKNKTAWWPEDVYGCLMSRQATGYTVHVGGDAIGFFITYPQQVPFSGETELFLWIMWSQPLAQRNGHDYGKVTLEVMRYLAVLALSQGHSAVGTLTVRKGLLRRYAHLWQSNVVSARIERDRLNELVNGVA